MALIPRIANMMYDQVQEEIRKAQNADKQVRLCFMYEMMQKMLCDLQPWIRPSSVQHIRVKVAWQQEEKIMG